MSLKMNQAEIDKIMIDDLDKLLDDADQSLTSLTARTEPSKNQTIRSNNYTVNKKTNDVSTPIVREETLVADQKKMVITMNDLLQETNPDEISLNLPRPKTTTRSKIPNCRLEIAAKVAAAGFFAQPKFCNMLKATIQDLYSVKTTITKGKDTTSLENDIYIIDFESESRERNEAAKRSLQPHIRTRETKLLDDQAGFWIKHPGCTQIVQAYGDQNEHLHILCEHSEIGLWISYFNKDKEKALHNLSANNATLDIIIKEKFSSVDIDLPSTSDLTTTNKSCLAQDILKIKDQMRSRSILMILEQRRIRLFGLVEIVNEIEEQIEEIKRKYASDNAKLSLEPKQIKYLMDICHEDLKALETTYQNAKIIETLKNGEFSAPSYLHDSIEQEITKLAILCTPIQFEIQEKAFGTIAHNQCLNLIWIGHQHKCQIEIQEDAEQLTCEIPKVAAQDHVSNKLTAAVITIEEGDLAAQKVDLVVICSTSMHLRDDILKKAGQSVKQEYIEAVKLSPSEPFETSSGQLACRKLLFLPWKIIQTSNEAFYQSIRDFVSEVVQHAIKAHHTSIAFPSIGCGKLNVDKNIIANEMLVEAQKQLLTANVLLQIIFVILPDQTDVFQAFQTKLKDLRKGKLETKDRQIPYSLTKLTITIISSTVEKQEECKKALNDHVQKSISVRELSQQGTLKKWTQPAIDSFYMFCLSRHVILGINTDSGDLKLFGSKESVAEAEIEYFREQANQSEQARLAAIARNIIWAYQIADNNWEKYPSELNAFIEDAHSSNIPSYNYTLNKSEEYTIDFKTMTETCTSTQTQRVISRHTDIDLPKHWDVQSETVATFPVPVESTEYSEIRVLFDTTMAGKYTKISYIKRIQNKQWYIQYNAYKSFSSKKSTERTLFHGCEKRSAELIINSFFNRSFAGVNGVVYGQGAYFSSKAAYSHGYAVPSKQNGERHMFVVNVLVGDAAPGNSSMKTPPEGFDSTTDKDHIFVTYRDDQAYATYLIIYQ